MSTCDTYTCLGVCVPPQPASCTQGCSDKQHGSGIAAVIQFAYEPNSCIRMVSGETNTSPSSSALARRSRVDGGDRLVKAFNESPNRNTGSRGYRRRLSVALPRPGCWRNTHRSSMLARPTPSKHAARSATSSSVMPHLAKSLAKRADTGGS